MDDAAEMFTVVAEALTSLSERIERVEEQLGTKSKPKRASTVPLPGRFPWKSPDDDLRYTQPLVTVES